MEKIKTIQGATSLETAYCVEDYPYGFKLRCKKYYYVETGKKGQRLVTVTTNPKAGDKLNKLNKPVVEKYFRLVVLFIDKETGYVCVDYLSYYANTAAVEAFMNKYELDPAQQKEIEYILLAKKKLDSYFEKNPIRI